MSDALVVEGRAFARAVLDRQQEIRPGDAFKGGVAMRAEEGELWLHPYMFRLVCKNGAIVAQTVTTRHVDLQVSLPEVAQFLIEEGVKACCAAEVFDVNVGRVRTLAEKQMDKTMMLMALMSRHGGMLSTPLMQNVIREMLGREMTAYDAMNGITARAREERDPVMKWELEELGGSLAVLKVPERPRMPAAAVRRGVLV